MTQKLIDTLERDIRNQVLIDQMKKLTHKGKLMVLVHRNIRRVWIVSLAIAWLAFFLWSINAWAADPSTPAAAPVMCPDVGVKCKVLFLSETEEQMLMTRNGILDTAAQGRALELGQFAVYLKQKIGTAQSGQVVLPPPPPAPAAPAPQTVPVPNTQPTENSLKTDKPVDKPQD
jgi:hypothetical protein